MLLALADSFTTTDNAQMSATYPDILTPPSSNEDSPRPLFLELSPGSSVFASPPEGTVPQSPPQMSNHMYMTSAHEVMNPANTNRNQGPKLRFIEQPTDKFRFRYRSEMAGTHGSLTGINSDRSRKSTYPTVELLNYTSQAIIRCSIYQITGVGKDYMPHAHRLIMKRGKDEFDDPHNIPVGGPNEGYEAQFHSMGIIHTAKRNLVTELIKKKMQLYKEYIARMEGPRELSVKELVEIRGAAEQESKLINLNIVCLRFDAFMVSNDIWYPICEPIYSHGINNLKSPLTGELKIVRIDHCTSPASGDKEIFVLVERVTKKNIKIRFYELDDDGHQVWEGYGTFSDLDVHHQYAIVFKTPRFRDENIQHPVRVFMELVRPSDGARSESKEFTYVPCHDKRGGKRARRNDSSWTSSSSVELPLTIQNLNSKPTGGATSPIVANSDPSSLSLPSSVDLSRAIANFNSDDFKKLFDTHADAYPMESHTIDTVQKLDHTAQYEMELPLYAEAQGPDTLPYNMPRPFRAKLESPHAEKSAMFKPRSISERLGELQLESKVLVKDVGLADVQMAARSHSELYKFAKTEPNMERTKKMLDKYFGADNTTNALHVFICLNRKEEVMFFLKIMYWAQELGLINNQDAHGNTPLHLAVTLNNLKVVEWLLRCKCNTLRRDNKGNTALHIAIEEAVSHTILELVCSSTPKLDKENYDGNTPLWVAIETKNMQAIRILCRQNVDINKKHNKSGFTPLRLAIEKQHSDIIKFLLLLPNLNFNLADFGGVTPYTAATLNECSADILETLRTYMRDRNMETEIKEEEEEDEEMEEIEEDVEIKLEPHFVSDMDELLKGIDKFTPKCLEEVSDILNKSGNWRHLADLLGLDHLLTSGLIPTTGNISENILKYATEIHNNSVVVIKNFLDNLGEREAVDSIHRMVTAHSS